jgi:Tol biopolymer transport system component
MGADGSDVKELTESPLWFQNPDWSPDGTKIAFFQGSADSPNRVWLMDTDGGNQEMLNDWGSYPAWSPDGRRIAFQSLRAGWQAFRELKFFDIYVMDADGSNVELLTGPDKLSDMYPVWSPDGTKIAFSSNRDGNYEIYVMDTDGSNVQRLTNTPEDEFESDWTAFSYALEPAGKLRSTWGNIKALLRRN